MLIELNERGKRGINISQSLRDVFIPFAPHFSANGDTKKEILGLGLRG
jgi:hypothetical protein